MGCPREERALPRGFSLCLNGHGWTDSIFLLPLGEEEFTGIGELRAEVRFLV